VQLELLNFPVERFERALQHAAGVQRELDVLRVDAEAAGHVPRRMDEVFADLDSRFTGYRATMDTLGVLIEQGTEHADVIIPILGEGEERASAIEALRDLLDEVDAYCEAGDQLLTVVTPPDLLEFRRWLFDEVIGQLRGASPHAWSGGSGTRVAAAVAVGARQADGEETLVVRESGALDLVAAPRVREAIQTAFTSDDGDVSVDLTAVDFVDSVILSVFVTAHKRFAAAERTISFIVPARLLPLFELTGLVGVLDVRTA
jgi:anti-anti-sigma factor